MEITKNLKDQKSELFEYFRTRSEELISEIEAKYGDRQFKKKAKASNILLIKTCNNLINTVLQQAEEEKWTNKEKLENILMITYTSNIVMLESRNSFWPYEYMTFSRRIGEIWEPFCKLCFKYPVNDIKYFVPPLFSKVKEDLTQEIKTFIDSLNISSEQKEQLKKYYDQVWGYVTSGEIKLELDLHFAFNKEKYVIDFKSGFGSNEKGNTNRLLLVASIYKNMKEKYNCLLFVRSAQNNNYFNTLKNSGVWEAYSGEDTYEQIHKYSGYDISNWIKTNIKWKEDINAVTYEHLESNDLLQYLDW